MGNMAVESTHGWKMDNGPQGQTETIKEEKLNLQQLAAA